MLRQWFITNAPFLKHHIKIALKFSFRSQLPDFYIIFKSKDLTVFIYHLWQAYSDIISYFPSIKLEFLNRTPSKNSLSLLKSRHIETLWLQSDQSNDKAD